MKRMLFLIPTMLAATLAFGQTVTGVDLSKDNGKGKPGDVVKAFGTSDNPIHFVVHVKPLSSPIILKGTLVAVDAGRFHNYTVATTNLTGVLSTVEVDFKFSVGANWPAGNYKFTLDAGEKHLRDISFEIK